MQYSIVSHFIPCLCVRRYVSSIEGQLTIVMDKNYYWEAAEVSQSHSSEKEPHKPPRLHKVHSPVETRWSFLSAVRASILKV